jgi:GDPmannose 4,6-dehydratase
VNTLCGDASKANEQLGWKPQVDFAALVAMMVDADLTRVAKEST